MGEQLFARAREEGVFIEAVFLESVMGEGNPGVAITSEFYAAARRLTLENDGCLLVDNIQAGFRTTGNLSIVDSVGFEGLDCPDFEVYSKAINGGQFPVSCLALSKRATSFYCHGIYGNTMTGNPRACLIFAAMLNNLTLEIRGNILKMGQYAVKQYKFLQKEFPDLITQVNGTGLLYAVQLNSKVFQVVAADGAEYVLRRQGLGVIHGGTNALRFTPHFRIKEAEIDLQVDMVRAFLKRMDSQAYQSLMPRLAAPATSESQAWEDYTSPSSPDGTIDPGFNVSLLVKGHLFDEGILTEVLNKVESHNGKARVLALKLGASVEETSEARVQVRVQGSEKIRQTLVSEFQQVNGVIVGE